MNKIVPIILVLSLLIASCKSYTPEQTINHGNENALVENDTVSISSDETDYEIVIIEPGFNVWLISTARPRGYYTQNWLEERNRLYVQAWNQRNMQPGVFDQNLYMLRIDYDARTDYGYEVNYLLYNYFVYFQLKYNQQLTSLIPRI
ncbi:DUF6146 family protein [Winogradskyella sp.]|uniref:DUF6146 family protein n=1 Tax=Winogradskyella sp. TaxID=1883156 RepID=UPI00262EE2DD|nr:DUF6146 family protein [Winogradskyella sp.]